MILKHISGMLCLLISYSKFTRPKVPHRLTDAAESATIKAQKGILPIDGQFRKLVTKSNREPRLKGGYFFVWFMYAIKIETMIPRIIRTTVSSS